MPQAKPIEILAEAPVQSIYANSTRLMYGVDDFRIVFSENMMRGDFSFVQVDRVSVVMSPQHLKRLLRTLAEKVTEYEDKFGPLPEEPKSSSEAPEGDAG